MVEEPMLVQALPRANLKDIRAVKADPNEGYPRITINGMDAGLEFIKDYPQRRRVVVPQKAITGVTSSYCPCKKCCGPRAQGLTRLETSAWKPGVAADWRYWKPGTMVIVDGYNDNKPVMVDDTGGAIKGKKRFDLRMTYHWQARDWGMKDVKVTIVSVPGE
jgi:3D (Asp-Asp-Asp) domain-containing protein